MAVLWLESSPAKIGVGAMAKADQKRNNMNVTLIPTLASTSREYSSNTEPVKYLNSSQL